MLGRQSDVGSVIGSQIEASGELQHLAECCRQFDRLDLDRQGAQQLAKPWQLAGVQAAATFRRAESVGEMLIVGAYLLRARPEAAARSEDIGVSRDGDAIER